MNAGITPVPHIICLIGSSRFKKTFLRLGHLFETQGMLVLSMAFFQHADGIYLSEQDRETLERVDRHRINLSDSVFVVNDFWERCVSCKTPYSPSGFPVRTCSCLPGTGFEMSPYVGESTLREIEYARSVGKSVSYLRGDNHAEGKPTEAQRASDHQTRHSKASEPEG